MGKFRNYITLFVRELQFTFIKDPRRGMLLLWASTLYLLLFGLLYQQGVINHIPVAVLDQNQTAISRQFIRDVDDTQRFDVVYYAQTQEELEQYIKSHHDFVAFQIPPHFAKDIQLGRASDILMFIDGNNLVMTSMSSIAGIEVGKAFSDKMAQQLLQHYSQMNPEKAKVTIKPVDISYRVLGNSTLSYLLFFALGLALAAYQQGILLSIAAAFRFKTQGIIEEERHMNAICRVLAKILPYWLISQLSMSLLIYVADHLLGIIDRAHSLWPLFGLTGSFSFCIIGLGVLIISFVKSELTFTRFSVLYTVPAFILTGFTWPLEGMGKGMQFLAHLSPMTYIANTFRNYYLNGYDAHIGSHSLVLTFTGLLMLSFGIYFYNKRVKRHFALVDHTRDYQAKQDISKTTQA